MTSSKIVIASSITQLVFIICSLKILFEYRHLNDVENHCSRKTIVKFDQFLSSNFKIIDEIMITFRSLNRQITVKYRKRLTSKNVMFKKWFQNG